MPMLDKREVDNKEVYLLLIVVKQVVVVCGVAFIGRFEGLTQANWRFVLIADLFEVGLFVFLLSEESLKNHSF